MRRAKTWISKCGMIELHLGDARRVLPQMPTESVDLIVTDPPYGHENNAGRDLISNLEAALGRGKCGAPRPILGDTAAEAGELSELLFAEAPRLLRRGGCCCYCCGGGGQDPQFARWALKMDGPLAFKQMVVWDKGAMGLGWHYRRSYETVLVGQKPGGPCKWNHLDRRVENIIRPGRYGIRKVIPRAHEHPTKKPTALAEHFILLHSQPGDVVLDPFCGAGWSAVAAVRRKRRYVGIELDSRWFSMAVRDAKAALAGRDVGGPWWELN